MWSFNRYGTIVDFFFFISVLFLNLPTRLLPTRKVQLASLDHVLFMFMRSGFWVGVAMATIVNTSPPPFLLLSCLRCYLKPEKMASKAEGEECYYETISSIQQCMHER